MKKIFLIKKVKLSLLLIFAFLLFLPKTIQLRADGGVGYKGIYINNKSTKSWYKVHDVDWNYTGCGDYQFKDAPSFDGVNFGKFNPDDKLEIAGFAVVGWTNSANDFVVGKLQYKIWKEGTPEPDAWTGHVTAGNYDEPCGDKSWQQVCSSGNDRVMGYIDSSLDIKPTEVGIYNFKIQALGRVNYCNGSFNTNDGPFMTAKFEVVQPTGYYYKSEGNVTWTDPSNWKVSTDGVNYTNASTAPSSVGEGELYQVIVDEGHTLTVTTDAATPSTGNFIVNGTLELGAGGSVSTAPTYGVGSTLIYNRDVTLPATEWPRYSIEGADYPENFTAGKFPHNVGVASGTLKIEAPDKLHKQYMGGDLTIESGAIVEFDMNQEDDPRDGDCFRVAGNLDNYGTIRQTNINRSAFSCTNFTNHSGATTTLSGDAKGGDLVVYGDFMNNGDNASAVNINGRALIFRGTADQTLGGSAPGAYEIDYLIIDKDGGVVTVEHDIICDGEGTDAGASNSGGGSITVMGNTILDLSDVTATVSEIGDAKYWSTIDCKDGGKIRTNAKTVLNIYGHQNNNTGNLSFDQSEPNVTNVIGQLNLDRVGGVLNFDNDFVVADKLQIKQGKLNGGTTASIRLDALAVGTLSSTNTTAALEVKDLVFTKVAGGEMNSAQFYKNGRTLTINGKVRTLVDFIQTDNWSFVSFPYAVTAATTLDGVSATDVSLGQYNAATRAQNVSGWENAVFPMEANKGYIVHKGSVGQLYFDGNVNGTDAMFNSTRTLTLTYTPAEALCNAGWNFIAHPLSVNGIPSLTDGEFAYRYDPSLDEYKLYFYQYNPGYSYTAGAAMKPFDALFVKTPNATTLNLSYNTATPQGVLRKAVKQAQAVIPDEIIRLNLLAQGKSYETLIRVKSEATAGEDVMYDAPYSTPMQVITPRMYTLINGTAYALNSVPENTTIPVGIRVPSTGEYTFTWEKGNEYQAVLKDKTAGKEIDMNKNLSYTFTVDAFGDINDRFEISVPQRTITNVALGNDDFGFDVSVAEGTILFNNLNAPAQISVFDVAGRLVEAKNVTSPQAVFNINRSGVYLLKVVDELGTDQIKVLVK